MHWSEASPVFTVKYVNGEYAAMLDWANWAASQWPVSCWFLINVKLLPRPGHNGFTPVPGLQIGSNNTTTQISIM